jgi:hypothetical protein
VRRGRLRVGNGVAKLLPQSAVAINQQEVLGLPGLEASLMGSRWISKRCQISEAFWELSSSGGIAADKLSDTFAVSDRAPGEFRGY